MREVLSFLDANKHAPNKITAFLKKIAQGIQAQGDPRQGVLFGTNEAKPLINLIRKARNDVENGGMSDIFSAKPEAQPSPKPEAQSTTKPETQPSPKPEAQPSPQPEAQTTQEVNDMQKTFRNAANRPLKELDDFSAGDMAEKRMEGGQTFETENGNLNINQTNANSQNMDAYIITLAIYSENPNRPLTEDALAPLKEEFERLEVVHSNVDVREDVTEITVILKGAYTELKAIPQNLDRKERAKRGREIGKRHLLKAKELSKGLLAIFEPSAFDGHFQKEEIDTIEAQPTPKPKAQPSTPKPEVQSTTQPTVQSTPQLTVQSTTQPETQSTPKPAAQSQAKPELKQREDKESLFGFGTDESSTNDLLDAFADFDPAKFNEEDSAESNDVIPEDKFINVVDDSDEANQKDIAELRKELNKLSAMPMFNPKVWTLGLKIGIRYLQRGINNFVAWAKKLRQDIGEDFEPWQKPLWETLKAMPKIEKFNDKQIWSTAKRIGYLYENGTTELEDIEKDFAEKLSAETMKAITPMIRATYKGIQKFFADQQQASEEQAQEPETSQRNKSAVNDEADRLISEAQDRASKAVSTLLKNFQAETDIKPLKEINADKPTVEISLYGKAVFEGKETPVPVRIQKSFGNAGD
ncbi:MAG: hypothetical protein IJP68_07490, partial [Selenomonadaceae bacterium]|nr:hypothetical protein [Selenomonadaceae bacterium]